MFLLLLTKTSVFIGTYTKRLKSIVTLFSHLSLSFLDGITSTGTLKYNGNNNNNNNNNKQVESCVTVEKPRTMNTSHSMQDCKLILWLES